jgi:hypothetical protein
MKIIPAINKSFCLISLLLIFVGSASAMPLTAGCYRGNISSPGDLEATSIWLKVLSSKNGLFSITENSGAITCDGNGNPSSNSVVSYRVRKNGSNYIGSQKNLCGIIFAANVSLNQKNANNLSYFRQEKGFIGAGGGAQIERNLRGKLLKNPLSKCR